MLKCFHKSTKNINFADKISVYGYWANKNAFWDNRQFT